MFPAHIQQLLVFVIEVGALFGVVVGAYGDELVLKCIYIKFQNLNLLQWVIAIKY